MTLAISLPGRFNACGAVSSFFSATGHTTAATLQESTQISTVALRCHSAFQLTPVPFEFLIIDFTTGIACLEDVQWRIFL